MTKPFLKYAGGKTRLLPQLLPLAPRVYGQYHEPFLGGGAMFFAMCPDRAILGDASLVLVRTYRGVRDSPDEVCEALAGLAAGHSEDAYYSQRSLDPAGMTDAVCAAWAIYLNKTCFNGLWRVNRAGRFNMPSGHVPVYQPDFAGIRAASEALAGARAIVHQDALRPEPALAPRPGDFVYLDPPYAALEGKQSFTGYTAGGFSSLNHVALRDYVVGLRDRGVSFMLSNKGTPEVRALYEAGGFRITEVQGPRSISRNGDDRKPVTEFIITA